MNNLLPDIFLDGTFWMESVIQLEFSLSKSLNFNNCGRKFEMEKLPMVIERAPPAVTIVNPGDVHSVKSRDDT